MWQSVKGAVLEENKRVLTTPLPPRYSSWSHTVVKRVGQLRTHLVTLYEHSPLHDKARQHALDAALQAIQEIEALLKITIFIFDDRESKMKHSLAVRNALLDLCDVIANHLEDLESDSDLNNCLPLLIQCVLRCLLISLCCV